MELEDFQAIEAEATTCFFCGKPIGEGRWFARLKHGSRRIIFCRPRCLELFLRKSKYALPEWVPYQPAGG